MNYFYRSLCLAVIVLFSVANSNATSVYPHKTITIIIPFSAGGPTDTVGRLIAQAMADNLKQSVIIENIAGAGGTIGVARAARAPADGYTLLLNHIGQATATVLYRQLPYNALHSFEPIGLITDVPMVLIARKDFPAQNLKELIAYVTANKDKVTYANAGLGSASHLCGMLFMSTISAAVTTVPYKGTGPAMNDLLGRQVDFMCDQTTNATNHIKSGKVRAYGVTTKERIASLANIPTLHEAGLPNFEIAIWHGLYAPRGTPQPVIQRLNQALYAALHNSVVRQRFAELGTAPVADSRINPAALRAHLANEIAKWTPIIQQAGVFAD